MQRKARINEVKARALTDPRPAFVSLVKGGANQRPFRAVRMEGADAAPLEPTKKENIMDMTIPDGYDIASLKFSSEHFADEATVKAWLDKGGYDGYSIEASEKGFVVTNDAVEFEVGSAEKISGAVDGLTVLVGKVSAEAPAEKTAEEATEEHAAANTSEVQPVATKSAEAEVADEDIDNVAREAAAKSEGDDAALEPTEDFKAEAAFKAVLEKMQKDGGPHTWEVSSLMSMMHTLRWLVVDADYEGTDPDVVKSIKSGASALLVALDGASDKMVEFFDATFKSMQPKATETTEKTEAPAETPAEVTEKSAETSEGEAEATKSEDAPADPVLAAIGKLTDTVKGLVGRVDSIEAKGEADEAAAKAESEERAKAEAATSQTRKGADVSTAKDEAPTPAQKAETDEEARQRRIRLRRAMGHPNPEAV